VRFRRLGRYKGWSDVMANSHHDAITGGIETVIDRAVTRRLKRAPVLTADLKKNADRFRRVHLAAEPNGRVSGAVGALLQELGAPLAEDIAHDEDFAGLLDQAFGDWLVSPSVDDLLEYELPRDFGLRVARAVDHFLRRHPEARGHHVPRGLVVGLGGGSVRQLLTRDSPV
jgi:hypothetical protein